MSIRHALAIDKTVALDVNGSTQRIRMCATRTGSPPLLIVQAGPGLPILNEVGKFQRRLRLEHHFYTTGVSWYEAKARIIRGAVRAYIANPVYNLP